MSSSNKNKFSTGEKIAWSAAGIATLGATALLSGPAHEEAPREKQPRIVTETLSGAEYQRQVEMPATELVGKFVTRLQRTRYFIEQQTGRREGQVTVEHADPNSHTDRTRTISVTKSPDGIGYVTELLGRPAIGEASISHGDTGTDIELYMDNGFENRTVTFHTEKDVAVDFDDPSTLVSAITDEGTMVQDVAVSGALSGPAFIDKAWYTGDGPVKTTFERSDSGGFTATIDLTTLQYASESAKELPSMNDVITWQIGE